MANYPQPGGYYPPPPPGYAPPAKQGGALKILLIVFAVFGLLTLLVCGGIVAAGYYAASRAKQFAVDVSRKALVDMVEQSEMDAEDKQVVKAQVDRVADDFQAGRITLEDVGRVMQELAQSPLFALLMVRAAEEKYVRPSGMSPEEKSEATLTLERTARGVYEKKIDQQSLETALDPICRADGQGNRQLKERVSDDELRAFLAECKRLADTAGIGQERFEVDIGDEFKRAVDRALAETGG